METYIPSCGRTVMIVAHKSKSLIGQLAKVMELDEKRHKAIVQYDISYDFESLVFISQYRNTIRLRNTLKGTIN
jgi:hypothetical protein